MDHFSFEDPSGFSRAQIDRSMQPEVPDFDTVAELFARHRSGDEQARDEVLRRHQRLVGRVAHRYVHYNVLELGDLMGYGNLGLMHAFRKYKPEMGVKFPTYAEDWVRAYITRALRNKTSTIRLPQHKKQRTEALKSGIGRITSLDALAEVNGKEGGRMDKIAALSDGTKTVSYAAAMNSILREPEKWGLNEREARFMRMYFIDDMSNTEIARVVGVTQVRVGQVLKGAILKLRVFFDVEAVAD